MIVAIPIINLGAIRTWYLISEMLQVVDVFNLNSMISEELVQGEKNRNGGPFSIPRCPRATSYDHEFEVSGVLVFGSRYNRGLAQSQDWRGSGGIAR